MRAIVTGASGQVGREFCRQLGKAATCLSKSDLDITDHIAVSRWIDRIRPSAIVNCAAYTHVDRAEQEVSTCTAVNADAVVNLATAATKIGSVLVQLSTDYVFGGNGIRFVPYTELDEPAPQNTYGITKLRGERNATSSTRHLIIRTCGLYGSEKSGNSFVDSIVRRAASGQSIRVVNDQCCNPTYIPHLVKAVRFLMASGCEGIYHIVSAGPTTWYEFAKEIVQMCAFDVPVIPITSSALQARACRPRYTALDTTKYLRTNGPALPIWREALSERFAGTSHRDAIKVVSNDGSP